MLSRLLLTGLAALLAGCHMEFGDSDRYHEDFHHSYKFPPGGKLVVENENGAVEITSWEKDEVEINGTKNASTPELLKDMKVQIDAAGNSIRVRVDRPDFRGNCGVRFAIRVPKKLELERIRSTNGSVHITGTEGPANLETTNGRIEVTGLTGRLTAETTNGSIELDGHKGEVRARTSNGRISGAVSTGVVDAHTTNGSIDLQLMDAVPSSMPVRLETTNGSINLKLAAPHEVRARTNNSSITLHLPAAADATLRARTSNSRIESDFGPGLNSEADEDDDHSKRKSLDAKVGKGGPVIDLSTSNGKIRILKI